MRVWATPLTMGAFALMAVTGLLMFFRWDVGMNKLAHEWLGWAMVAAAILHGFVNFGMVKRHFASRGGLAVMGACLAVLAGSFFVSPPTKAKPPHVVAVQALLDAPLTVTAQVAGKDVDKALAGLSAAGFTATPDQSLRAVAGRERDVQMKALGAVFSK